MFLFSEFFFRTGNRKSVIIVTKTAAFAFLCVALSEVFVNLFIELFTKLSTRRRQVAEFGMF